MAKPLQMRKISGLEAIEIPGQPDGLCVVMMHGYGADATDLVPLANVISVPQGTRWLFPNGPLQVPIGQRVYAQGWFPVDIAAFEKARSEGKLRDMAKDTPPGMKKAREQVFEMLKALNIPIEKTIFAGFSQGAMMATALTLYSPVKPKGLIILSGALLDEKSWTEKSKARAGLSFFQSHGVYDEILGVEGAKLLEKTLTDSGLKGRLQLFEGGHEIPQEVIHGVNKYLKDLK